MEMAPAKSYNFNDETYIRAIANQYKAKYMGSWCIKDKVGNWSENAVEVFYQLNPDKSKGHSHYFGIFINLYNQIMICNAESAFSEPIIGILEDGLVYVSRYRHNYVSTPKGSVIDGGRDYTRVPSLADDSKFVEVQVIDGNFCFTHKD